MEKQTFDICIIGAGSGGLSVAAASAQMGALVALVEEDKMGGDCLNYGCVPSKSLLAVAKRAHLIKQAPELGLETGAVKTDFAKVMAYVRSVIEQIAPHDSTTRFEQLGVKVFSGSGRFLDKKTLEVHDTLIKARHFVIATGSSPAIPPIPGLNEGIYYTNESIFDLNEKPQHLIIIGGGPIGCEIAQAFLLLGVKVTLLEANTILPHDEPDLVNTLRQELINQELHLFETANITKVEMQTHNIVVHYENHGVNQTVQGSHLFVATGRKPNVQRLNLAAANVQHTNKGIKVNAKLRTTNSRIYAIGDVIGQYQFTHVANYHAGIVIRNIFFKIPAKVNYIALPWVTFTYPELAHVGLSSKEALKKYPKAKVFSNAFKENDRAQAEHASLGQIKMTVSPKGKILGATILGAEAGELLLPWIIAIHNDMTLRAFTDVIIPYPTLSETTKQIAGEFYKPLLYSKLVKTWIKVLRFLGL